MATRISTEVMYSATEMVLDNPNLDAAQITAEVCEMLVRYFDKFAENEALHRDPGGKARRRRRPPLLVSRQRSSAQVISTR